MAIAFLQQGGEQTTPYPQIPQKLNGTPMPRDVRRCVDF